MYSSKVEQIRKELLSLFPCIESETLNLNAKHIEQNFLLKANLPKILLSYIEKMEYVESWTFTNLIKTSKDIEILNNLEVSLPLVLTSLSLRYDQEVSIYLNYLLARMPIQKTIYIIKYLDDIHTVYLDDLYLTNDENSDIVIKRLNTLINVLKLSNVFSHSNFDYILRLLSGK